MTDLIERIEGAGRIVASLSAGWAAMMLARASGMPLWIDWPRDWSMTDASDVAVLVALSVWSGIGALKARGIE